MVIGNGDEIYIFNINLLSEVELELYHLRS